MARKIFWSVFLLLVAYAGVVFTNFSSSSKIEEALRDMGGDSMPVGIYGQEVIKFYNENQRWPSPSEIVFPAPPATGIVRSVDLDPDGVLVLGLRGLVWLQRIHVKVAVILQSGPEEFRWTSACVEVRPRSMANVIYGHCGRSTLADVQETQEQVIAIQAKRLKDRNLRDTHVKQ